ncbi:MAG: hypothetical protein O7D86_04160 [Proteobacteria bacterium]|nr:hypothetical protein [Pseudomonadota bacterium]
MVRLVSGVLSSLFFILNAQADIYSASNALSRGDYATAVAEFTKLSEKGDARVQVHLGSMYHTGEGVEQNNSEAVRWYRMAADRGDATAQYNLGTLYRSGKGVEQNYSQAKRWFRQATDQGYAAAQNELVSLERSAAANVATRTIQAKPEILPIEETNQVVAQQTTESTTPVQIAKTEPAPEPVAANESIADIEEPAKKPLFSVEKKNRLTLDKSELDIVEPVTPAETEIEKQVTTQDELPGVEVPAEIADVAEPASVNTALGIHIPSNAESGSSGGLFSALGKFFSGGDKKTETTFSEHDIQTESDDVLIAKVEAPAPVIDEIELAQEVEIDLSQYSVSAGRRALRYSDYNEAVKQFKPLAENGDSEAQAHLGSLYYVGNGVKQNFNEAYNWYRKSADQDNMDAQYSIGNMYLLGEGVEQNNSDAAKWYALAADQGHDSAKHNLANLQKTQITEPQLEIETSTINNTQLVSLDSDITTASIEVAPISRTVN